MNHIELENKLIKLIAKEHGLNASNIDNTSILVESGKFGDTKRYIKVFFNYGTSEGDYNCTSDDLKE